MNMNISRRWFIGGAASFGALGGCRMFESNEFKAGGSPRIKFGVVSDIHFICEDTDRGWQGNDFTFKHTLKYFDAQGVDAVIIAGDMADAGVISQLRKVADAWNSVFPGNYSLRDGRRVEKLFVYGNHDWEGFRYDYNLYGRSSKDLIYDQIREYGMKKAWEEIFEEEYSPIYRKTIKGFDFIGQHWDNQGWGEECKFELIAPFMDKVKSAIDPNLPFFYFQHPHPKDTCYGSWAWGHDTGVVTKTLSAYPNAVAFSGHSHYSLTDERSIWQGAFTSVGTASLRYMGDPYDELTKSDDCGFGFDVIDKCGERQGMVWSVYDDCMIAERRDFIHDVKVGPDWVIPLPAAESKPFAFVERAKKIAAPEFPEGAQLKVVEGSQRVKVAAGSGEKKKEVVKPTIEVVIPNVIAKDLGRVWRFKIEAKDAKGKTIVCQPLAAGFTHAIGHKRTKATTVGWFLKESLAKGDIEISVTPINCFNKAGKALVSCYSNK